MELRERRTGFESLPCELRLAILEYVLAENMKQSIVSFCLHLPDTQI